MKEDTHPIYQDVLFVDSSTGFRFVCGSTLQPKERELFEQKEYPVFHVSISSASHPFYTGANQFVDSEGQVNKFQKRYSKKVLEKPESPDSKEAVKPVKKVKKKSS